MSETEIAELVIRGGTIVDASGRMRGDLVVADGRVSALLPPGAACPAVRELDASGCFVIPGAVDAHVHLDGPAVPGVPGFVDDLLTGTRAAVHGGVTTVGQMSFTDGPTFSGALERDRRRGAEQAVIDYVLHPGIYCVTREALEEIPALAGMGAGTVKLVTLSLDEGGAPYFGDALAAAAAAGLLPMIHCEDGAIIDQATHALERAGRTGLEHYPDSRPAVSESAAVERAIALAEGAGAQIYIVHLSSAAALDAVRAARSRGRRVFVETRPIYLYLSREVHEDTEGAKFIGMPPLREQHDIEALWAGLADGTIDTVATDHAPWMLADKVDSQLDLASSRKGVAELDTFLPLLYDRGVRTGRLTLERLVAVTAANPARILGLHPRKGNLGVGADADIVVLDPELVREIRAEELESASDYSVYQGWRVAGWPRFVVSRGEVLLEDGIVSAEPGRGRFLRPTARRAPL